MRSSALLTVAAALLAIAPARAQHAAPYSFIVIDNQDRDASFDLMNAISFGLPRELRARVSSLGRFDRTPRLEVQFSGSCEDGAPLLAAVTELVRRSSAVAVTCDAAPPTERAPYPG